MNSIDPRVMKQLLQLQMLNKVSLLSGNSSSNSEDSSDFGALLEAVMGQVSAGGGQGQLSLDKGTHVASGSLRALNSAYTPLRTASKSAGSSQFDPLIEEAGNRYGVDSSLVKAVIQQESSFNHRAVSEAGAKGLMQLMDDTGAGFGVTNPFDPAQNVNAGTHFLGNLLKKYKGNEGVALAAYNAGPGRVDRLGIQNDQDLAAKLHLLPKETQAYVNKVLGYKQSFSV